MQVEMSSLGTATDHRGVSRKWQCPNCRAIHWETVHETPPLLERPTFSIRQFLPAKPAAI